MIYDIVIINPRSRLRPYCECYVRFFFTGEVVVVAFVRINSLIVFNRFLTQPILLVYAAFRVKSVKYALFKRYRSWKEKLRIGVILCSHYRNTEYSFTGLWYSTIGGIDYFPEVLVAIAFKQFEPMVEVWAEAFAYQVLYILQNNVFRSLYPHCFFYAPNERGTCA